MRLLALLVALGPSVASSADELALFKDAASTILVERNLAITEQGAYVCVSIEGKGPTPEQLASYQKLGIREVGSPNECECKEHEPSDQCFRKSSEQPACLLSISEFKFVAFTNASASVVESCGWPKGGGEVAQFEKREGTWVYVGASSHIVL